jgi:aspartate aminotransferase-like enzyme
MKGKLFRIAHLGFFDYMDTIAFLGALEQVASALKFPGFAFGRALTAAQNEFVACQQNAKAQAKSPALAGAER